MIAAKSRARVLFLVATSLSLLGFFAAPARAQQKWELQHGGTIFDAFTVTTAANGTEIWTVEDGGRVRHRNNAGAWTFQDVPREQDLFYRAQFLDDGRTGWVVGLGGLLGVTSDGGANWGHPMTNFPFVGAALWDVHFINTMRGWLVEKHGLYRTESGGVGASTWNETVILLDQQGNFLPSGLPDFELYSLDLVSRTTSVPDHGPFPCLGLMCGSPGVILRSTDGITWQVVFDIRTIACSLPPGCVKDNLCSPTPQNFAAWDIEISRNSTQPLALMVGGVANACGLILASTDAGLTWHIEPHECECNPPTMQGCQDCTLNALYRDDLTRTEDTWRLPQLYTLYSVSIFDGDNSAIAGGYSGQHVVRNPTANPNVGIWQDRSAYSSDIVHAVGAVTAPMYATAADSGTASTGVGLIAGAGGFVRRTTNGGQSWVPEFAGDPWRLQDICFINNTTGWVVGQFFRIAKSTDSGATWDDPANYVTPEPSTTGLYLNSIAMDSTGGRGVAVGDAPRPGTRPQIRYTRNTSGKTWLDAQAFIDHPSMPVGANLGKSLREVEWANGQNFWTAGDVGLLYSTTDGGQTWRQVVPPGSVGYPSIASFYVWGIALRDANTVLLVGYAGSSVQACLYRGGATPSWTVVPVNAAPGTSIVTLSDVDVRPGGNLAYAVGVQVVAGLEQGVILSCNLSSPVPRFDVVPNSPVILSNTVAQDLNSVPVLNRVQMAPNGDVWVAGECGRIWRLSSGQWSETKSQTSGHIRGLSFPASGNGFAAALSKGYAAYSIVRYH